MIVECYLCQAKVDGKVLGVHSVDSEDAPGTFHIALLECPNCKAGVLGGRYEFEDGPLDRLWPRPEEFFSPKIPQAIRNSMHEARLCFKAGAYSACTVMAGRALEGLVRHFSSKQTYLGPGIVDLHKRGIIDARLAEWASALQKARNLSAHESGESVSKRDAEDLLDFLNAICDYVFVLTAKFEEYMARKPKPKSPAAGSK